MKNESYSSDLPSLRSKLGKVRSLRRAAEDVNNNNFCMLVPRSWLLETAMTEELKLENSIVQKVGIKTGDEIEQGL